MCAGHVSTPCKSKHLCMPTHLVHFQNRPPQPRHFQQCSWQERVESAQSSHWGYRKCVSRAGAETPWQARPLGTMSVCTMQEHNPYSGTCTPSCLLAIANSVHTQTAKSHFVSLQLSPHVSQSHLTALHHWCLTLHDKHTTMLTVSRQNVYNGEITLNNKMQN